MTKNFQHHQLDTMDTWLARGTYCKGSKIISKKKRRKRITLSQTIDKLKVWNLSGFVKIEDTGRSEKKRLLSPTQ